MHIYQTYEEAEANTGSCAVAQFSVTQLPGITFNISLLRLVFGQKTYASAYLSCEAKGIVFERGFSVTRWNKTGEFDCPTELRKVLAREDFTSNVLAPLAQKVGYVIGTKVNIHPAQWR